MPPWKGFAPDPDSRNRQAYGSILLLALGKDTAFASFEPDLQHLSCYGILELAADVRLASCCKAQALCLYRPDLWFCGWAQLV